MNCQEALAFTTSVAWGHCDDPEYEEDWDDYCDHIHACPLCDEVFHATTDREYFHAIHWMNTEPPIEFNLTPRSA